MRRSSGLRVAVLSVMAVCALFCAGCSDDGKTKADSAPPADGPAVTPDGPAVTPDGPATDAAVAQDEGTSPDTAPPVPCEFTQTIEYVADGVKGDEPCGPSDGTCVSGTLIFDESLVVIAEGDIGEAYLFGKPTAAPLIIFRTTTPPQQMPFKIPNISKTITDACSSFQLGGRLDVGGNNQGLPGGPEDPVIAPASRVTVTLFEGTQHNGLEIK